MIRQLIAIFFFAGLLFQNLNRLLVMADYNLNKNFIVKNLCENKNKPSMHCNGKCYLAKKLQEEEKQQAPGSQRLIPEIQLFFANTNIEITSITGLLSTALYGRYNIMHAISLSNAVFRPPILS